MWTLAIQNGLLYGLMLSALMSALFMGGIRLSPDVMMRGYPPDIKAKYGALSAKGQQLRRPMAALLFVFLFGTVALSILALGQAAELTFASVFVSTFVALLTFNLVDLLVLDWLIFVTLQPKFVILPGTEGMAGYKDYAFHFKAFLRGSALCLIASLIIAAVTLGVTAIL